MGIIIDINIDTIYPVLNYKKSNMFRSLFYTSLTHTFIPYIIYKYRHCECIVSLRRETH